MSPLTTPSTAFSAGLLQTSPGTLVDAEISRYLDPTLGERLREVEWELKNQLGRIRKSILEPHQDAIDALTADYEQIILDFEEWEKQARDTWLQIANYLKDGKPDVAGFERPNPREAQETDGVVLFDSKRDYLTQLDHYHLWQLRWGRKTS